MPHFRYLFPAAAALFALLGAGQAHAQTTIDYFNFNNTSPSGTSGTASIGHTSTQGGGTGRGSLFNGFGTSKSIYDTGTTTNAQNSDGAGNALVLQGGTSSNTKYLILTTNATGYQNLMLSFATDKNSTGFSSDQLSYSTNGSSYTDYSTAYNPATSFATQRFDLSGIAALNNNPTVYLKITFSGATDPAGTNTIDNFLLTGTATPAPAGIVSLSIGLGMAGLSAWARRRRQARQQPVLNSSSE